MISIPEAPQPPSPPQKKIKFPDTFCFSHCSNCFLSNCQSSECEIIPCPLNCGYRMHACKIQEHKLHLCPFNVVECINKEIGCPHFMQRRLLSQHIQYCPASIVHCTVEWNRMPRLLGEKIPFLPPLSCQCCKSSHTSPERNSSSRANNYCLTSYHTKQFDLALTARDQSVLEAGTKVSNKTKGVLRSHFTKLYPALPMTSPFYHGAFMVSPDGSKFPLISSPLAVLSVTPNGIPITKQQGVLRPLNFDDTDDGDDTDCDQSSVTSFLTFSPTAIITNDTDDFAHSLPDNCTMTLAALDAFDPSAGDEASAVMTAAKRPHLRSTSLSDQLSWAISDRSLQVDCQMELFPRYVQKPSAMYTFLCDHDVRRSDFEGHSRLHSDALVQVNYWLEQRCPLAYLGCPFSAVRLRPNLPNADLVYLPASATFSVRYPTQASCPVLIATPTCTGSPRLLLDDLPPEIILHLFRFLDDLSLISLSRVSARLATLCNTLLLSRGIVTPIWRRVCCQPTGLVTWKITQFVWTFPFKGEGISRWHISEDMIGSRMANHLTVCKHNHIVRAEAPFCLHSLSQKLPFQ